ncbi:MAG TPA: LLM class flavin-dependent oxidoreductase, partial [Candidatus Saccharimonadales bacterium]|nr:LLM class flavin-dependent oxidoreductase [Candidatus Saccharimonadales bacterium]
MIEYKVSTRRHVCGSALHFQAWAIWPQPSNLIEVAQEAERLGYDTLWTADRLLFPLNPRTKYPVTADGSWPEVYKRVLDPIESLTFVATHTRRIGLGTSVLDLPFYNPVILARRL